MTMAELTAVLRRSRALDGWAGRETAAALTEEMALTALPAQTGENAGSGKRENALAGQDTARGAARLLTQMELGRRINGSFGQTGGDHGPVTATNTDGTAAAVAGGWEGGPATRQAAAGGADAARLSRIYEQDARRYDGVIG